MTIYGGPEIVTDGLVLHLDAANSKSYSGSGTAWNDLSGNGNNGTLTNGPIYSSDNKGNIILDGTNDYISTNNINLSNTNKTSIDFWCKILSYPEASGLGNILIELSTDSNNVTTGFSINYSEDCCAIYNKTFPIAIGLKGNNGYNISYWPKTLVNDLQWHHWCVILDKSVSGAESFLYIDSISRTGTLTSLANDNSNNYGDLPLYIGARGASASGSFHSNVRISNIKIYNRTLTQNEILQNYNALKGRFGL